MFELTGVPAAEAAKKAATVMRIETDLAQGSLDIVARRDPKALVHKYATKDLAALSPAFDSSNISASQGTRLRDAERRDARFHQGDEQGDRRLRPGRPQGLPGLALHQRERLRAAAGVRRRELRFLRQDAQRRRTTQAALEALRPSNRWGPRRSHRPQVRRKDIRRAGQGAHARDGRADRAGHGRPISSRSPG